MRFRKYFHLSQEVSKINPIERSMLLLSRARINTTAVDHSIPFKIVDPMNSYHIHLLVFIPCRMAVKGWFAPLPHLRPPPPHHRGHKSMIKRFWHSSTAKAVPAVVPLPRPDTSPAPRPIFCRALKATRARLQSGDGGGCGLIAGDAGGDGGPGQA